MAPLTVEETGRGIILRLIGEVERHETGTRSGKDKEAVHQMRVAIRRLRVALQIFGPGFAKGAWKPLAKDLRKFGAALGDVRDEDIFLEWLKEHAATVPDDHLPALNRLREFHLKSRALLRRSLVRNLNGPSYFGLMAALHAVLLEGGRKSRRLPFFRFVSKILRREWKSVRRLLDDLPKKPRPDELHRLRIALKQLRYTGDFLRGSEDRRLPLELENMLKAWVGEIRVMLNHLGNIHDAVLHEGMLKEFLRSEPKSAGKSGELSKTVRAAERERRAFRRGSFGRFQKRRAKFAGKRGIKRARTLIKRLTRADRTSRILNEDAQGEEVGRINQVPARPMRERRWSNDAVLINGE